MSKPVIICVDDEKLVTESLRDTLAVAFVNDYVVECAESGKDALALALRLLAGGTDIPVVISDYAMPEMKGDELFRHLHAVSPRTLKIMLTGRAGIEGIAGVLNDGGLHRCITKPWDSAQLVAFVRQAAHEYFRKKQEEERNLAILNAIPDLMFLIGRNGAFLDCRCPPSAQDQLFLPREQFIGRLFDDVLPPRLAALLREKLDAVEADGQAGRFDYSIPIGGVERLFEARLTRCGQDAFLLLARDITGHRRAEDAVRRQMQFDALINKLLARFAGCRGSEIDNHIHIGMAELGVFMEADTVLVLQPSSSRDSWKTAYAWTAADGGFAEAEAGLLPLDAQCLLAGGTVASNPPADAGEDARARLAIPFRGLGGQIIGCIDLHSPSRREDWTGEEIRQLKITCDAVANALERKWAEEEIHCLLSAIEQVPDSILITDTDGVIEYVNPGFERISGYSRNEVVGQTPRMLKSGRHENDFYREMWGRISRGDPWHGIVTNRKKDGTLYTEDTVITPVRDKAGEVTNFIAVRRDITREQEAEDRYRQAQKLESVGRLAGGIAHDFNNILMVITGNLDMVLHSLPPGHAMAAELESSRKAAERAATLTRQLLIFARRQIVEPRIFDPGELVANLGKMLQRLIGEDIMLKLDVTADTGKIKADPGQLEQVIVNMAVNARDAMPEGGTLTISTTCEMVDGRNDEQFVNLAPGRYIRISVQDTGTGMEEEVQQHIFEPFFTTKPPGSGTGLGLATSFGIIRQNSGHILFDSTPGSGTTFHIYLPLAGSGASSTQFLRDLQAAAPKGSETLLLVEDDPHVRQTVARMLKNHDYNVLEANGGVDAIALARQHRNSISLLVTDVVMPEMNGTELADVLLGICPGIRILFISGYVQTHTVVQQAVNQSGAQFLQKPFASDDLARKVRGILDSAPA